MAPTRVHEPFHRDGWVYEEKVDGWRILAYKDGPHVWLVSATALITLAASATWLWRSRRSWLGS